MAALCRSVQMEESIFFGDLPDLESLCAVKLIMKSDISDPSIRNKQVKLSRCLLFLHDHIVASPIPEQFRHILVIMSISFYKTGNLQAVADKEQFTMEMPERVNPAMLQACLFYTITVRLAPYWNKAGHLLIQGADFLSKSGKQNAVAISINVLDNQIFMTVHVHTVQMPPSQLRDFDVASKCFQSSLTWNTSFMRKKSDSSNWCYVLPSMKMGRVVHLSHDIPPECPFKSYKEFQNYWKTLEENLVLPTKKYKTSKTVKKMDVEQQAKDNKDENLVLPTKKYKTSKTIKKMDVEQQAKDNKLFKVNNADLQDWLKRHGISTRTRDKKEQLVAKIMQFIQQS